MTVRNLIVVLGDQLSVGLSSLAAGDPNKDLVLLMEVQDEATYVRHHKKKIAFIFSAMRHFAEALRQAGWTVDYVRLEAPGNTGSFAGEVERAIGRHNPERFIITEPGEWRVRDAMQRWSGDFQIDVQVVDDDRFICSHTEFKSWTEGRKQLRMEHFYREMRRKTGLLMAGDQPAGGQWNYDSENRKPAKDNLFMPQPKRTEPDNITAEVLDLVAARFNNNFGDLQPFWFAVTAEQAQLVLARFIEVALPSFGDYQDAMLRGKPFLYHSLIALYINTGLLDPLAVCQRVEREYVEGRAPLNAVEGFIRQIIGWREYVRGIYWLKMPKYVDQNFLGATRALPDFYWTGDTDMACLRAAIVQTREEAYAHHIQRLMVTGNFAMLAGVDPKAIHEWYLAVYADAYEWVELPNTLGMSQFADAGLLGSKPYASSGNYINKMSNYCADCAYDVKKKTGDGACPFNPLYWSFLVRNDAKLRSNPRMAQTYRTWDRMTDEKKSKYLESAAKILDTLE
jgi:deoxyribodipyrimidine photolyase-related protein